MNFSYRSLRRHLSAAAAGIGGIACAFVAVCWSHERKRGAGVLEELQHRKLLLDEAQKLTHIGSWEWDVVADSVTWSDELYRIYGIDSSDFNGSYDAYLLLVHPDDRASVDAAIRKCFADHQSYSFEHRVVRPDGSVRIMLSRGGAHLDKKTQQVARLTGTGQDITDRHLAETRLRRAHSDLERRVADRTAELLKLNGELEEAVRARDMFLSIASHELRTPLNALSLAVESLVRDSQEGERARHELMLRQVNRLSLLVENLLEVSRITAGRLQLVPEEVELCELTHDVVSRFSLESRRARAPINVATCGRLDGYWDRLRLEQILTNLLSNAMKYGSGQPVDVSVDKYHSGVRLVVRDHGVGIAPADQARIFEPFQRVLGERHVGGFGLGLWIVRQIVEALGGEIRVHSAPGAGAEFVVTLPTQPLAQDSQDAFARA